MDEFFDMAEAFDRPCCSCSNFTYYTKLLPNHYYVRFCQYSTFVRFCQYDRFEDIFIAAKDEIFEMAKAFDSPFFRASPVAFLQIDKTASLPVRSF
jgi:hypothetical protein